MQYENIAGSSVVLGPEEEASNKSKSSKQRAEKKASTPIER